MFTPINKYCRVCNKLVSLEVYGNTTPCPECGSILAKQSTSDDTLNLGSTTQSDDRSQLQAPEQIFKSSGTPNRLRLIGTMIKVSIVIVALGSITYRLAQTPTMVEKMDPNILPEKLAETTHIDLKEFSCSFEKNTSFATNDEYAKIAYISGKIGRLTDVKLELDVFVEIVNKAGDVLEHRGTSIRPDDTFKVSFPASLPLRRHAHKCRILNFETSLGNKVKFTSTNGTRADAIML